MLLGPFVRGLACSWLADLLATFVVISSVSRDVGSLPSRDVLTLCKRPTLNSARCVTAMMCRLVVDMIVWCFATSVFLEIMLTVFKGKTLFFCHGIAGSAF